MLQASQNNIESQGTSSIHHKTHIWEGFCDQNGKRLSVFAFLLKIKWLLGILILLIFMSVIILVKTDFSSSKVTNLRLLLTWKQLDHNPQQQNTSRQHDSSAQSIKNTHQDLANYTGYGISQRKIKNAIEYLELKRMDLKKSNALADRQRKYYEKKYKISRYAELPICAVIPSYNNQPNNRALNNIASVIQQEYKNYQIVFIDDASTDNTFQIVSEFLLQNDFPMNKTTLIKNGIHQYTIVNLRKAAKNYCDPESIFIVIDGDDELIGRQVFKLYNAIFQEKGVWFLYSNYLDAKGLKAGFSYPFPQQTIQNNSYRSFYPFLVTHLRAFYTSLFNKIRQQDLKDSHGIYFRTANDVAIVYPILQMSHTRVLYLPQIVYYYNSNTGLNNYVIRSKEQINNEYQIRRKVHYAPLYSLYDQA